MEGVSLEMEDLRVEVNENFLKDPEVEALAEKGILITPPLGKEDSWYARVRVSENQYVCTFPKFRTFGIGFLNEEEDWNRNLPYTFAPGEILKHISINSKGADQEICLRAIRLLQMFLADHFRDREFDN